MDERMSAPDDAGALVPSLVLDNDVSGDLVKTSSAEEANESSDDSDDASAHRLEESGTHLPKKC